MAERSLRRRLFEYLVVLMALAGLGVVLLPVRAYSGPGPSANRRSVLGNATYGVVDYYGEKNGGFPADLSPESPLLKQYRDRRPFALRSHEEQDPVPPMLWNPALEGAQFEDVKNPERTILYFEGADDKRGNRYVAFINGRSMPIPAPIVIDAILHHGGVVSDLLVREPPPSISKKSKNKLKGAHLK